MENKGLGILIDLIIKFVMKIALGLSMITAIINYHDYNSDIFHLFYNITMWLSLLLIVVNTILGIIAFIKLIIAIINTDKHKIIREIGDLIIPSIDNTIILVLMFITHTFTYATSI